MVGVASAQSCGPVRRTIPGGLAWRTRAHGRTLPLERAVRAGLVAIDATRRLDDERARVYVDLVLMALGEAARTAVEARIMKNDKYQFIKNYKYQSDFAKKYFGQTRAAEKAEGKAEGKSEAILVMLRHRGFELTPAQRERVLRESDDAQLNAWIASALTATSVADALGATAATS